MDEKRMIRVGLSKKQLSKMRNGHKVRIRPAMEGSGIPVVFDVDNYSLVTKSFSRNKGVDVVLSPQEILENKEASMQGEGIFGKRFDRAVGKVIGKKARKVLYDELREYLPQAQAGLTAGLTSGAAALALNPTTAFLAPYLPTAVAGLSTLGSDYLADPSKYQSMAEMVINPSKRKVAKTLAGQYVQQKALEGLNRELGTNMGSLTRSGIEEAVVNRASEELENRRRDRIGSRRGMYRRELMPSPMEGEGLYAGSGLYAGTRGSGMRTAYRRRQTGIVGARGSLIHGGAVGSFTPQALQSQPYSENYQFRYTLPPAYLKGNGLYV